MRNKIVSVAETALEVCIIGLSSAIKIVNNRGLALLTAGLLFQFLEYVEQQVDKIKGHSFTFSSTIILQQLQGLLFGELIFVFTFYTKLLSVDLNLNLDFLYKFW